MSFFYELERRNPLLFWYGVLNLIAAITCVILIQVTDVQVNGINAFIKPLKFNVSITIFVWTMGWVMYYLERPSKVKYYNLMAVVVLSYEIIIITWQAANGRLSHFNITSIFYSMLFSLMGIAITILAVWTGYIGYLFVRKTTWSVPMAYVWGMRLGIIFFVVFSMEGGLMAAVLRHTVGGADNGSGLPVLNWSRQHGDLRIAHFFGMHSLQLLPLFGYYVAKNTRVMVAAAFIYLLFVSALLAQALMGMPLF